MLEKSFPIFQYFVETYIKIINSGGSFNREELINLFQHYEEPQSTRQLLDEANRLEEIINKEDWEIDKNILNFIMKNNGKKNIRDWIHNIKRQLK